MGSQPIRIQLGKILRENLAGKSCGKFLRENLAGNSCGKILREMGKSCGKFLREILGEKARKANWWKFSIWNRVMGSQPIRIQLGKILREILREISCGKIVAGKSCGKLLRENLAGNCCGKILGKFLRENLVGKCGKFCGKILREILAGKWRRGKSQFKKGSDWWKFSIWKRVMGSQPIRIQLAGKSCGKLLRENLAGNSCGKILREILEGKFKKGLIGEI